MDDLISRQEVIKAVTYGALSSATLFGRSDAGMIALRETVRVIKQLPSAQPENVFEIGKPYPLKGFEFKIWKDAYGDDWVEIRKSTVETTLPTGHVYRCDPEKNKDCRKTGCYINGGDCYLTQHAEYAKEERR